MSEPTDQNLPAIASTAPSTHPRLAIVALIVSLAVLLALAWSWQSQQQRIKNIEQALTLRLSEFELRSQESRVLAKRADESTSQVAIRIGMLDQKLEESRSQLDALQTLYLEVANNRDAWAISDVEQLLIIASQQLQLAGNVKSALLAMQTADSRLQQIDKPQVVQLRKTLSQDIQRLQALPSVDITGMSLRLQTVLETIDQLPLVSERHPQIVKPLAPPSDASPWQRLLQEIWLDLKRMVRVERIDRPEPPLLAPEQNYFLRENLKLRLLAARLALLQHDQTSYRSDLQAAEVWIKRHFDTRDAATLNVLALLKTLSSSDILIEIPDVSASLGAVSKYKLSMERGRP